MTEIISKTLAVTVPTILLGYFIDFSQSFKTAREHGVKLTESLAQSPTLSQVGSALMTRTKPKET